MSLARRSSPRVPHQCTLTGLLIAAAAALCVSMLGDVTLAHEHLHTHQNLARASFRLLNAPFFETRRFGHLTKQDIENEIAQGVIDEDECVAFDDTGNGIDWAEVPYWNSHFYEAKQGIRLTIPVAPGCGNPSIGGHTTAA